MSEHRRIGPVDAMWLNMDRPNNLMVIDSVMWFDETIDWERLGPLIQRRLVDRYPLFSQRPVASFIPFGTSRWEDDPDFDLSQHLRRVTLPAPGDQEVLRDTGTQTLRDGLHTISLIPELANPSRVMEVLELGWAAGKIADKLLLGRNPQTPFSGEPGVDKRAVWSGPRKIKEVKRVSRLTGATVNDVLVAAVSGAVNTYLRDHGADPVDLTTMIPVNVRPPDQPLPRELGNKFALVYLKMPTGVRAPLERVSETKRRMDWIKVSPEAIITFGLNRVIGSIEPHVANSIVGFFSDKAIGVTTNVVGPQSQRYVAGAPIAGAVAWVPGSGRHSLGVCIFSLAGVVRVGFKVDAGMVPDVEKLVHAFDEDLDQLLRIAANAE